MGTAVGPKSRLVSVLALFVFLVAPSIPVSASIGTAPTWSLGQRWAFKGTLWAPGPREDFTATVTVDELGKGNARVRAEIVYGFGTVVEDTLVALPSFAVLSISASFPRGTHWEFRYDPPLRLFSFPLSAGRHWDSASNFTYSYRVLPPTALRTPAGVFDVFPVEQNAMGIPFITQQLIVPGLGRAVVYYSDRVGQIVRYEAFEKAGGLVAEFSLISPPAPPRAEAPASPLWGMATVLALVVVGVLTIRGLGRRIRLWRVRPGP